MIVGRGCLGRPWLFRELAQAFDGEEPSPPPNLGEVIEIMLDHARRLMNFFGADMGMRQMRKWCGWYTIGFHGASKVRGELVRVTSLEEMREALSRLDPASEFPENALRARRGKGAKTQRVTLPEGFLENREDDEPPKDPRTPEEIRAWEKALSGS